MTINIFLNIFFIAKIKLLNFFNSDDRKAKVYFSLFEKIDQNVKEDVERQNNHALYRRKFEKLRTQFFMNFQQLEKDVNLENENFKSA